MRSVNLRMARLIACIRIKINYSIDEVPLGKKEDCKGSGASLILDIYLR